MRGVLAALGVTLLLELPVVAAAYPGQRARLTAVALVANTCTNLTLNVVLPLWPLLRGHHVLAGEVLAVVVEAAALAAASRPRDVGRALLVSGLGNALSYGAGGAVLAMLRRW
jgi:hypothetical protein